MEIEESLSPTDAANEVGANRTTLEAAIKRGDVPSVKDKSKRVHVLLDDVKAWWSKSREGQVGRPRGSSKTAADEASD